MPVPRRERTGQEPRIPGLEVSTLSERRCHATIPVADLAGARAFYEGVLGFAPYRETPAALMCDAGESSKFAGTQSSGKAERGLQDWAASP